MKYQRIISPCNNICKLDQPQDICLGCGRTSYEITHWIFYSDEERENIMVQLEARLHKHRNENSSKASR